MQEKEVKFSDTFESESMQSRRRTVFYLAMSGTGVTQLTLAEQTVTAVVLPLLNNLHLMQKYSQGNC
jgi:hypothetical protein